MLFSKIDVALLHQTYEPPRPSRFTQLDEISQSPAADALNLKPRLQIFYHVF
jgi:hypothetical protein